MSDEILSLIYTFSKKFSDPETNLSFDPKNQNISAVVKEGNVNISLLVKGQKEDLIDKKDDVPPFIEKKIKSA